MTGLGKTSALQRISGDGRRGFEMNNVTDFFTVINTVGTTTNNLDIGRATNQPAGYCRVSLVP